MTVKETIEALKICYTKDSGCEECPLHKVEECNNELAFEAMKHLYELSKALEEAKPQTQIRIFNEDTGEVMEGMMEANADE